MRYKIIIKWSDSPADELLCKSMEEVREWYRMGAKYPTAVFTCIDLVKNETILITI